MQADPCKFYVNLLHSQKQMLKLTGYEKSFFMSEMQIRP